MDPAVRMALTPKGVVRVIAVKRLWKDLFNCFYPNIRKTTCQDTEQTLLQKCNDGQNLTFPLDNIFREALI